MKALLLDIYYH